MTYNSVKSEKRDGSSNNSLIFLILVGMLAFILFSFLDFKIIKKTTQADRELKELQAEIQKQKIRRGQLSKKIGEAEGGEYLERIAREDLNLKKTGEKVVAFSLPEVEKSKITQEGERKGFFGKLLEKLGIK